MDYFNDRERIYQQRFAARRDRFFHPMIARLDRFGATPNRISFLGVSFLAVACLVPASYPWVAVFFFWRTCSVTALMGRWLA